MVDATVHATEPRIAVIGAGLAGMTCAKHLRQRGFHATVFEKSRGLGGRLATRRLADGIAFDHGAQYITARSGPFRAFIADVVARGAAGHWRPIAQGRPSSSAEHWIVGNPAMNALVKPLADGIDVRLQTEVAAIHRDGRGWRVLTRGNGAGEAFDRVVCTAPAPQARRLLASEPVLANVLGDISIAPCWALMLTFATAYDPGFDVWRSMSRDLAWISRNSSKPARAGHRDGWVVHASPAWSEHNLENAPDHIVDSMIEMLPDAFGGQLPHIEHAAAHRWRYALTTAPLGRPFLCSEDGSLFVGGDWCLGARVEAAFESGRAMAEAVPGVAGV